MDKLRASGKGKRGSGVGEDGVEGESVLRDAWNWGALLGWG